MIAYIMDINKQNLLLKSASYFAVANGALIFVMKLYGYAETNSASVFASVVDSGLDITSSILNMLALRFALVPPDENHRFGHEKIQDLAVFGQGIFFIASSFFVVANSFYKLKSHSEVTNPESGLIVIFLSTILTFSLVLYQTYVLSKVKSSIIKADKLHYLTDLLSNIVVAISIYFSASYWYIDGIFGILIAIYLFWGAYEIMREGLCNLLDQEVDEKDKAKIIKILMKYKARREIIAIHDLKTRMAANKLFIQFHVEFDGNMKLYDSHIITEKIEKDILKIFPVAQIIIHQDPSGIDEDTPFRDELDGPK
ncbi:MAG: cation diffusion facilitator family transporter [Rickettsiaceae bacterium]|nr:cation diffusion facilitator family transporter [Rickettsiaceae bacterium]